MLEAILFVICIILTAFVIVKPLAEAAGTMVGEWLVKKW